MGCRRSGLEMSTKEGGGRGRVQGRDGAGDEHGDTVGQEVAGCQKWRMASMVEGDEGMNIGSMDPQRQQRL